MDKGKSEHHGRAVHFKESATKHHRAAELEYGSGDHKKAAHDAQLSNANGSHPSRHAEVTAGEMIEHHGMQPAPVKRHPATAFAQKVSKKKPITPK